MPAFLARPGAKSQRLRQAASALTWATVGAQQGFRIARRRSFGSYLATLQAAAHGSGVALGLFPLSTAWLSTAAPREGGTR